MAVLVEAIVALALAAVLARAAFGAPPAHPDPVAAAGWLVTGLLLLGLVIADAGGAAWGLVLNAVAVLALAVSGWWMRGGNDDDGGDEPGEPPIDWDELDRLREDWSRPRHPARL